MTELTQNKCVSCRPDTPQLTAEEMSGLLAQVSGWNVVTGDRIVKSWKFKDFAQALAQVTAIGALAETEGHHPDIRFGWGYLEITLTTHEMKGLSRNDFIMAAKIDKLTTNT